MKTIVCTDESESSFCGRIRELRQFNVMSSLKLFLSSHHIVDNIKPDSLRIT